MVMMIVIVAMVVMIVIVAVLMAMMVMRARVVVPAGGIAADVPVWQGVFRCRASHFFLFRWFDLMPLKTL